MGGRRRDQGEILADLRTGQTLSVAAASSRSSSPGSASPADVIAERLSRLPRTTPAYARRLQKVCRLRGGPQGQMGLRAGHLLITVAVGCQYVTAAAHSDAYAWSPVPLLISFSYDLRRCLYAAQEAFRC